MRSALALLLMAFAMSAGVALFLSQCAAQEHEVTLSVFAPAAEVRVVLAEWVEDGREVEDGGYEGRKRSVLLLLEPRGDGRSLVLMRGPDAEEVRAVRDELSELLGAPARGWKTRR